MSPVPVVAIITARPGQENALEAVLRALLAPTHLEAGSVTYALHRSIENPRTFVFIEKWISQESLKQHLSTAHIAQAMARKAELIEEFRVIPLESMPGGNLAKGVF